MRIPHISLLIVLFSTFVATELPTKCWAREVTLLGKKVRFYPPRSEAQWFQYIDFIVPVDTKEILVSLHYPDDGHELVKWGTLEVGMFGPNDSFRGWSGGRRETIIIGEKEATPGYIAGPITSGQWRLLVAPNSRLEPEGVLCEIEITARTSQSSTPSGPKWFRGDFHIHNEHTDGAFSVPTLVSRFRAAGLDFGVVSESRCCRRTEHNAPSDLHEISVFSPNVPLLILFAEVGNALGHFNALGLPPRAWLDLKIDESSAGLERLISETHKAGALFSINHPFRGCCVWKLEIPKTVDCVEVWNGGVGDGLWDSSDEKAVAWWDSLLAKGVTTTAIGGSDCHFTADVKWVGKDDRGRPGRPTTWVQADSLDTPAILKGVRAGRVFITAGPAVSPVSFLLRDPETGKQAGIGQTLLITGDEMEIEVAFDHPAPVKIKAIAEGKPRLEKMLLPGTAPLRVRLTAQGPYLRLEISDQQTGGMLALTNPIWVSK